MPTLRLTAKGVDSLAAAEDRAEFWDDLTPGLGLRVSGVTGRKTWVVRYRASGKHRRQTIGRYPGLSLADARNKARDILSRAAGGEDPALDAQAVEDDASTFEAMAREVLEAKAKTTRQSTQDERERILEAELIPEWGARPPGSISRREVLHLVESIADRGAPSMANHVLALIKVLYNEALARDFPGVEYNPAHRVRPPGAKGARDRFLEAGQLGRPNEIRTLWRTLESERTVTQGIFRMTLLTAQRVGSVRAMRWSDIDEADVWTIPAESFKGRRPNMVPLSVEALRVLDDLRPAKSEYVFPGRADGAKPYVGSVNSALRRVRNDAGLEHWTLHDLRTTFRTHAVRDASPGHPKDPAGLGVAPHIADAVLGHAEASLGFRRYTGDRTRYLLSEKRDALERWGRFVREAVEAVD